MPLRRKIAVVAIFALGSFVIITGVIRLIMLVGVYSSLDDPTWVDISCRPSPLHMCDRSGISNRSIDEYSRPILWTVVELNLGVTCACLPLMRPVWRATMESPVFTRLLSSLTTRYQSFDKSSEAEMGSMRGESGDTGRRFELGHSG